MQQQPQAKRRATEFSRESIKKRALKRHSESNTKMEIRRYAGTCIENYHDLPPLPLPPNRPTRDVTGNLALTDRRIPKRGVSHFLLLTSLGAHISRTTRYFGQSTVEHINGNFCSADSSQERQLQIAARNPPPRLCYFPKNVSSFRNASLIPHLLFGSLEPVLVRGEGLAQTLNVPLPDMRVKLLRRLVPFPVGLEAGQPRL